MFIYDLESVKLTRAGNLTLEYGFFSSKIKKSNGVFNKMHMLICPIAFSNIKTQYFLLVRK